MTLSKYITGKHLSTDASIHTLLVVRVCKPVCFNRNIMSYSTVTSKYSASLLNLWGDKRMVKHYTSTTTVTWPTQGKTTLRRPRVADGGFCNKSAALDYAASPARFTAITNYSLQALEFEKKICRAGFRKNFGQNLPSPGTLKIHFGLLDVNPTHNSSRWSKTNKSAPLKMGWSTQADHVRKSRGRPDFVAEKLDLCFKNRAQLVPTNDVRKRHVVGTNNNHEKMDKSLIHSGIQLMSSDWILEGLTQQIQNRRSVRAVMHELIRDAEVLLNSLRNTCPVMGVRITASGRLGKQKKGMAQLQSLSIGKVPLGTFSRKVDYSQGFALTKRGLVGLKVWVAFR